jgi:hypothetical protein
MRKTRLEIANPAEWLRELSQDDGYGRLVSESGGAARAAYRLAQAHCRVETGEAPRLEDLQAAAALLAARLGGRDALPIVSLLPAAPVAAIETVSAKSSRPLVQAVARSLPPPAPSSRRRAQSQSRPEASRASL